MAISQFDDIITQAISQAGLLPRLNFQDTFALVNAVIQKESSFDPNALSSAGAIGLMQVNPSFWGFYIDLYDPFTNVMQGIKILQQYITSYGLSGGLAAYHAGPSGMYLQVAKDYAATVLSYFNTFRQKVSSLFSSIIGGGEYYVDPGNVASVPNISDISSVASFLTTDTAPPPPSSSFVDVSGYSQAEPDYSWLYIAAAVVLIFVFMNKS